MKKILVLLVLSLAANATLLLRHGGAAWKASLSATSATETAPAPPPLASESSRRAVATEAALASSPSSTLPPLAADDFAGLATRLRNAGVPTHIANFAVAFAIDRHFEQVREERGLRPGGFLRSPVTHATSESAEITAARAQVDAEERAAMQAHVGELGKMSFDAQRQLTGNLPDAKARQLLKIVADYRDMQARIYIDHPDRGGADAREKVALLEKERRADIERLLTPDELFEYDLRTSATGGMIRNRIGRFPLQEAEFRALHTALAEAAKAADAAGVPPRKRDRDPLYEPEIRRVLGEERYAELQATAEREQARIRTYSEMMRFVSGQNLPVQAANDLLVLQADYSPRLAALGAARTATPEQRDAQLAALAQEARTRVKHVLGEKAFEAYRQGTGAWLEPR